jgi:ribosomal subunit interface protein
MERPLQLTFKGMDSSPALESLVRERLSRLERLYPRLVGCRVVVEVPHRKSETAKMPLAVTVELEIPGRGTVVGKDEVARRAAKEDHTAALNGAFEAVERQLAKIHDIRSNGPEGNAAPWPRAE